MSDSDCLRTRIRTIAFGAHMTEIQLSTRLAASFDEAFGLLGPTQQGEASSRLEARDEDGLALLRRRGRLEWSCKVEEFIPLLRAELTDVALRIGGYEVALHAGAYVRNGRVLLLLGSPGAGKTTLGAALTASGFDLLSDDVVLLHEGGSVSGLPFPPASKSGAWDLVAPYWPDVIDARTHVRPDGQRVRYAPYIPRADLGRLRVGSIAILNRVPGARAGLEHADPVEVLRLLLGEGTSVTERLTGVGFSSLIDALCGARCCVLTYSNLADATRCIHEFCL